MKTMENENDVQKVEKTTESPSDENKQAEQESDASEGVKTLEEDGNKEQKTVPYERFKEVNDKYKELLSANKPTEKEIQSQAADLSEATGESYEDALKVVRQEAEKVASKQIQELTRKMELDRVIDKNPDFYNFADQVKDLVKENPTISWEQALKLAKFDAGQTQKATPKVEKKTASVESASKSKSVPTTSEAIDPLAKGPDGKFLYSTKELEDVLK